MLATVSHAQKKVGAFEPVSIAVASLNERKMRQVIVHELGHLKRRDLVWCWIPELVRIFYFFHPIAYWVRYRIQLNQELACDHMTMALGGHGPTEYANTLVEVVSHTSEPAVLKAVGTVTAGLDGNRDKREHEGYDEKGRNR